MRFPYTASLLTLCFAAQVAVASEQPSMVRQDAAATGWSLVTIASASLTLIAIAALVYTVRRFLIRQAGRTKNEPRQLLHELCQAHGLSRRAERLLRKAAAAVGTPHPGRFFLEPELWRQAQKVEELKDSRLALSLLYERLYGEDVA